MTDYEEAPEFAFLHLQAQELRAFVLESLRSIVSEHPEWLKTLDARSTCIQSLWNVVRFGELSLSYLRKHLSDPKWWIGIRGPDPSPKEVAFEFTAYSQSAKTGMFHLALSAVENSHRSFLRALDPTAAAGARAEYKSIYEALLRSRLQLGPEPLLLLDLLRHVRNTIHNEGVHRPPSSGQVVVTYRDVQYEFTDGQPLEFVTWEFVLNRVRDLVALQGSVVMHPALASHPDHIADASADLFPTDAT